METRFNKLDKINRHNFIDALIKLNDFAPRRDALLNQMLVDISGTAISELLTALPDHHKGYFVDLKNLLQETIELLSDTIHARLFEAPVITPQGTTYSKRTLTNWLTVQNTDPISRATLTQDMLIDNALVYELKEILLRSVNMPDKDTLQRLISCPITGKPFETPVVAEDGVTYEKTALETYLKANRNTTPSGITQNKPLYKNRLIETLLSEEIATKTLYEKWVAFFETHHKDTFTPEANPASPSCLPPISVEELACLEAQKAQITNDLEKYLKQRNNDSSLFNLVGSLFSKHPYENKMHSATTALNVVQGREKLDTLLQNNELKEPFDDGRLGELHIVDRLIELQKQEVTIANETPAPRMK